MPEEKIQEVFWVVASSLVKFWYSFSIQLSFLNFGQRFLLYHYGGFNKVLTNFWFELGVNISKSISSSYQDIKRKKEKPANEGLIKKAKANLSQPKILNLNSFKEQAAEGWGLSISPEDNFRACYIGYIWWLRSSIERNYTQCPNVISQLLFDIHNYP